MTPEDYKTHYLILQKAITDLTAKINYLDKLRDTAAEKLHEHALANSAALTPLGDGQTIEVNGAEYYVDGDVLADVDAETKVLTITLFALNVETGEPTSLHLAPQPGTDWAYKLATSKTPESVEEFLDKICPDGKAEA